MVLHVPTIDAMAANDPTIHLYERPEHARIAEQYPPTDQRAWLSPVREIEG
jgi:hypothetical protein